MTLLFLIITYQTSMWKQLYKKYLGAKIPVVNVHGLINAECTQRVATRLSKIRTTGAEALAVSINSPGGYPVQSELICNKIRDFASKHNLKVYTFGKDVAASGGYFVLCTGHEVYADKTSIVGSIGVVFPKYQLEGVLDITSVQMKRLYSNKQSFASIFDPFSKISEKDREEVLKMCSSTHEKFISHVKKYRQEKLKIDDKIFSGEIYNGEEAKEIGLIDGVGSMVEVLEQKYPGCKIDLEVPKSFPGSFLV